jgi:hypothetical protein
MAMLRLMLLMGLAAFVAACGLLGGPTIFKDANGLRTFPLPDAHGPCSQIAAIDPVRGTLHGARGGSDQAWLVTTNGDHASVVWPQGFTVAFDPVFALVDEHGTVVAREGDEVTLAQVPTTAATGLYGDPYFASGSLFSGCYPRRLSSVERAA